MESAARDERYTPGLDRESVTFMTTRSTQTHAQFFLPHITSGTSILDLGCGPGSITIGLAAIATPASVLGLDQGGTQFDRAREHCAQLGLSNVEFIEGSCYDIPLPDRSVDRVFSHALFEHLADPHRALAEIRRVLRPGGIVGLCSPDWGGFILTPPTTEVDHALRIYMDLQSSNGGNPLAGRHLGTWLAAAEFTQIRTDARYERYASATPIASYLATQLDNAGHPTHAHNLRIWASGPAAMFAQTWISATAVTPT
jgi:ubiquinone/menaquinone biosynthesis C-methylase UbiE